MTDKPMTMSEDDLCDLEDELDVLIDRLYWNTFGSDKTRQEVSWTDKDHERLKFLQQLLYG